MKKKGPRHHRSKGTLPKELLPRSDERLVIGRRAVEESIRHAPERLQRLYFVEGREPGFRIPGELPKIALTNEALSELAQSESHQGIVAVVRSETRSLKQLVAELHDTPRSLLVALDSVTDPQNIGSIMRAAECFGASGILWSHNRGPGLTGVVSKTSAGATELLPTVLVSNLAQALRDLKEAGFWVVAADAGSDSVPLNEFEYPDRTVLVMGSEGAGLRPLTRELCDYVVRIPMVGKIASLNVSQASAIFLAAWCGRLKGA